MKAMPVQSLRRKLGSGRRSSVGLYAFLHVGQSRILLTIPFVTKQSVQRCLRQELQVLSCSAQMVPPQTSQIALDFWSQSEHFWVSSQIIFPVAAWSIFR